MVQNYVQVILWVKVGLGVLGAMATVLPDADQFFECYFILDGRDDGLELRGQLFLDARGVECSSCHGDIMLLLGVVASVSSLCVEAPCGLLYLFRSICL